MGHDCAEINTQAVQLEPGLEANSTAWQGNGLGWEGVYYYDVTIIIVAMNAAETLSALGFTDVEAQVFCELLRRSPATGYTLAKQLGKAPGNVHQVLSSLVKKGAVLIDEGVTRSYWAVPPDELLASLAHEFDQRKKAAHAALSSLYTAPQVDRIYQFTNVRQMYERARQLIGNAQETLLFDLFPIPMATLKDELEAAVKRGVRVRGVVYDDVGPAGAEVKRGLVADRIIEIWPGQHVTLIADAKELLLALLDEEGRAVRHGLGSDSAYLAFLLHSGVTAELSISDGASMEDVMRNMTIPVSLRQPE